MEELSIADDMADDLEDDMATTSIMHNFVFRGPEVAERFAKILEESANEPPRPSTVNVKFLDDPDEIRECMNRLKQSIEQQGMLGAATQDSSELEAAATLEERE